MTECCGQPSFCEKPCFHDCGRLTPGRAGSIAGVLEERGQRYGEFEGHAAISQALKDAMRTIQAGSVFQTPSVKVWRWCSTRLPVC